MIFAHKFFFLQMRNWGWPTFFVPELDLALRRLAIDHLSPSFCLKRSLLHPWCVFSMKNNDFFYRVSTITSFKPKFEPIRNLILCSLRILRSRNLFCSFLFRWTKIMDVFNILSYESWRDKLINQYIQNTYLCTYLLVFSKFDKKNWPITK